jgi:tRNA dimethylallyltransferase
MPSTKENKPLIVILGPTAVGKTEMAINVAKKLDGEIVSADSRLLYRGMDIGTAKPSASEQKVVRHHLIDVAEPDEIWSLADFQKAANEIISDIHERGRMAFLVGGSGQYIRAIAQGWSPPPLAANPELRERLEGWAEEVGKNGLFERLQKLDPKAAEKMDSRNLRRTIRALEVIFSTGRLFSGQRRLIEPKYRLIQIGLMRTREELYTRIDQRIRQMLNAGWLKEIEGLLAAGYDEKIASMSAIGYAQLIEHLRGNIDLEEAIKLIKRSSRSYVRTQANWFKSDDPEINWFDAADNNSKTKIEKLILSKLNKS